MLQVHSLQIALSRQGFSCHEEELEWWQFGDTTYSALLTFQARSCDSATGSRYYFGGQKLCAECFGRQFVTWLFCKLAELQDRCKLWVCACRHAQDSLRAGVADERTWVALLGEGADPAVVGTMQSGDDTDTDLTSSHESQGVWLVGEQRWERRRA